MISPRDLRAKVIKPTCDMLGLGGDPVEELLIGTAAQESNLGDRLDQLGGPARGIWQMEPATHDDLWTNFLSSKDRADLWRRISLLLLPGLTKLDQLEGNLYYACAMARIQYYRSPRPIPSAGDLRGQGELYKAAYNTAGGAASVDQYVANAKRVLGAST